MELKEELHALASLIGQGLLRVTEAIAGMHVRPNDEVMDASAQEAALRAAAAEACIRIADDALAAHPGSILLSRVRELLEDYRLRATGEFESEAQRSEGLAWSRKILANLGDKPT